MTKTGHPSGMNIAFIGNYLPRKCGIATFTTDLCESTAGFTDEDCRCSVVAVNDIPETYRYPDRVTFEIQQNIEHDYISAANYLNTTADIVCLQHEFGIFGGVAGSHVTTLLKKLRLPVVTTLHTILEHPKPEYAETAAEIYRLSDRLVTMSRRGVEILKTVYGVPDRKICYIPHGIPDMPFIDPNYYKKRFNVEGKTVMLTFNLMSPGKGLETAIKALPGIVSRHPDFVYIILGAVHPGTGDQGKAYRQSLEKLAVDLGVEKNVIFHTRFVSLEELIEFLGCADLYVTPYIDREQITSGTLAYAMGAGKAVISTPYRYAEEMLADGRGCLTPFSDPDALATTIINLLSDDDGRHEMRRQAYDYCRSMIWPEVAGQYVDLFKELSLQSDRHPVTVIGARNVSGNEPAVMELPKIKLDHLYTMTDDTGIFQHARMAIPNRHHGYCTDDNGRALITTALYHNLHRFSNIRSLTHKYLSFIDYAFNEENRRFRGFMSYDRRWLDEMGSEDAHGRALHGLGITVLLPADASILAHAATLFDKAAAAADSFVYPRAQAYTLLGLHAYLSRFEGDLASRRLQKRLTNRLLSAFKKNRKEEWPWLEDTLTYDNARLPQALILSGHQMGDSKAIDIGLKALDWLFELQTHRCGHLSIIGNDGWCVRNDRQARFDQQPLDAHGLLEAALAAYFVERSHKWLQRARQSINWFLGHNDTGEPLVDFTTGACCDGLCADGPNLNRGAESTLSWLTALLLAGGSQKLDFIWDYPKEANSTRVLGEADASSVSDGQVVGSE